MFIFTLNHLETSMDNIGQLLIRLLKLHRKAIATKLSPLKLFPGQDGLLYHLSKNDGLTMTELIEKLKIKHPTLFSMTKRMEAEGFIYKQKDKSDKRTSRIFLTDKGREITGELTQKWFEIEAQLSRDLSESEKKQAIDLLNKLIKNLSNSDYHE